MSWLIAFLSVPIAYCTHKIVEIFYPGRLQNLAYNVGWNILEYCSKVEMQVANRYNKIVEYFPFLQRNAAHTISVVHDGNEVANYELTFFLKMRERVKKGTYDFIFYELPVNDKFRCDTYVIRYESPDDIARIVYNTFSDFRFNVIKFNFKDDDTIYNLNFKRMQYIVSGNILFDFKFLCWYMNKFHKVTIKAEDSYILSFVDHNMNFVTLNEHSHIVIKEKDYEVVTNIEATENKTAL